MCKTHSLDSTAQGNLLTEQVDLLSKHVNLLFAAHFTIELQWKKMIKLEDNDTGGAMAAQTHCANSTNKTGFTMTRK